jgi:hypothetical protein
MPLSYNSKNVAVHNSITFDIMSIGVPIALPDTTFPGCAGIVAFRDLPKMGVDWDEMKIEETRRPVRVEIGPLAGLPVRNDMAGTVAGGVPTGGVALARECQCAYPKANKTTPPVKESECGIPSPGALSPPGKGTGADAGLD